MDAKLLIVDDDAAIRNSMSEFLVAAGYPTHKAPTAETALELLKDEEIHIVITDILMPGMDGLELTDCISKDYPHIDIIVMTGFSAEYSYADAVSKGASDFIFKPVRFEELLLRLQRVLREREYARERKLMLEKLEKLAITDGLTKLYNSRYFFKQLRNEINRSNRYHHPLALMLLDIDHFKDYNDTFGHLEGDKVLVKIGLIIQSCLRRMDSAYRYGGEEFTIILPETTVAEAFSVAPRIQDALKQTTFQPQPDQPIKVSVSIGVTQYSPSEDISAFVQRADQAMYLSKRKGRDTISALHQDEAPPDLTPPQSTPS
jgi:diguanylate cyclase (GGDEF)-like protein